MNAQRTTITIMLLMPSVTIAESHHGMTPLQAVRSLMALELYAEAHDELLDALQHRDAPVERLIAVGWQLGERHLDTQRDLLILRDTLTDTIVERAGECAYTIGRLAAVNRGLQDPRHTVEVYDRLVQFYPDSAGVAQLREQCFEQLVADHRYRELYDHIDLIRFTDRVICDRLVRHDDPADRARHEHARRIQAALAARIALHYEVLVAVGDDSRAARVAEKALRIDSSADTYHALAWHGYLGGRPSARCLDFAKKAARLAPADMDVADTLNRIVSARATTLPIRGLSVSQASRSGF